MAFVFTKNGKIFVAQYNLTPYTTEMTPTGNRLLLSATVLGDGGMRHFPGIDESTWNWRGLFDEATAGSDAILASIKASTVKIASIWPDDATAGKFGQGSEFFTNSDERSSRVGNLVEATGSFSVHGQMERIQSIIPSTTYAATTASASRNDASSSANGGTWFFHVTAWSASGGNARWQLTLQDSPDDSVWSTLDGPVNITAVIGTRRAFTGTVEQYVRLNAVLDATSGSITLSVGYHRDGVF